MVLPPPMQGSLPAGWLAFAGREFNPLDHDKRFQFVSSSSSGFILAQGKFHDALSRINSQFAYRDLWNIRRGISGAARSRYEGSIGHAQNWYIDVSSRP